MAVALIMGTLTFAGLGLLLAGTLRAEATLALANGLFLAALLLGGIVVPVADLPGPLAGVAGILPVAALSEALRVGLGVPATRLGPRRPRRLGSGRRTWRPSAGSAGIEPTRIPCRG